MSHCIDGVGVAERVDVTDADAVCVIDPDTVPVRESVPVEAGDTDIVADLAEVAEFE